jgi:hypothetical protein
MISVIAHLLDVFLLFFLQSQFYKNLLKLFIAVVDDELFKAVLLQRYKDPTYNKCNAFRPYFNNKPSND